MPRARRTGAEHNARYGWPHRNERARRLADLRAHPGQPCARGCGRPLYADQPVHLDHDDTDPTGRTYLPGLSCEHCNTSAGARRGNAGHRHQRYAPPASSVDTQARPPLLVGEHDCPVHGRCRWRLPCW